MEGRYYSNSRSPLTTVDDKTIVDFYEVEREENIDFKRMEEPTPF
jgi:hypothetical protein